MLRFYRRDYSTIMPSYDRHQTGAASSEEARFRARLLLSVFAWIRLSCSKLLSCRIKSGRKLDENENGLSRYF